MIRAFVSFFILINFCSVFAQNQNIVFNDLKFKEAILKSNKQVDVNLDGEISVNEAINVKTLNLSKSGITNLDEINLFKNIELLYCPSNQIKRIKLKGLHSLKKLIISDNGMETLEITDCPSLFSIMCQANNLDALNIQGLVNLEILWCQQNKLSSLNLYGCYSLRSLYCDENKLKEINLTGLIQLKDFRCTNNLLKEIDIKDSSAIAFLYCGNNENLEILFLQNRKREVYPFFIDFSDCLNLKKICVDDEKYEIDEINKKINLYNRNDIKVSTNCN